MWVHDVYTGNDAPKGTGSALMQAAAHRAMRDGADFSVQGVVPHASGFYHALGGTRKPNYSSFEWTPEDRDALAMGAPNRKPITPMSGTWTANPTYTPGGSFEENNHLKDPVMPPGADDPVGYGEMFVDRSKRLRTAYEQGRKQAMDWHSPAVGRSQLPGDAKWEVRHKIPADLDYLSDESYDPYHEPGDRPRFAVDPPQPHSKWYHTTPAELQPGDRITPRGGPSPDESYYELGRENRPNHVWLSPNPNTAFLWKDWAGDNSHIYEVHPGDTPQAWGLNQGAGFVAPHATVKRRVGDRHKIAMAAHDGVFWHGSPSGELAGGPYGLHVGSYLAAKQALEARIGRRADGKDWDGTQEYGKTLLDRNQYSSLWHPDTKTWSRHMVENPPDYAPADRPPRYSDGTPVAMESKPNLFPVRITGPMSNTPDTPHSDTRANGLMRGLVTRGKANRGFYYTNEGEGVHTDPLTGNLKYDISAVVPNGGTHLERLDRTQHPAPPGDFTPKHNTGYSAEMGRTSRWFKRKGIQQPPKGLQMHYFPDQDSVDAAYGSGGEIQAPVVTAHHPDSKYQPTGFLQWDTAEHPERPNTISWIDVDPDFRRQGIGAAMYEHAKRFNPDLQHSEQRSIEGDDWAHAVGGHLPPLMDEDDDDWMEEKR